MSLDTDAIVAIVQLCLTASERETVSADLPAWADPTQLRTPPDLVQACVAVLKQQTDLVIFDDHMQQIGSSATRVSLEGLARWLIRRAMEVGSEEAVAGLRRYISSSTYPVEETFLLGGVTVDETNEVADEITLLPFDALPASPHKKAFTPNWGSPTDLARQQPSAALHCQTTFPKHHGAGPT